MDRSGEGNSPPVTKTGGLLLPYLSLVALVVFGACSSRLDEFPEGSWRFQSGVAYGQMIEYTSDDQFWPILVFDPQLGPILEGNCNDIQLAPPEEDATGLFQIGWTTEASCPTEYSELIDLRLAAALSDAEVLDLAGDELVFTGSGIEVRFVSLSSLVPTSNAPARGVFRFRSASVRGSEIDFDSGGHSMPALVLSASGGWYLQGSCNEFLLLDAEPGAVTLFNGYAGTDGPCDDLAAERLDQGLAKALLTATSIERIGPDLLFTGPDLDARFLEEQ